MKTNGVSHVRLLMHTDVRWLSKGKVLLTRVHELHKELIALFDKEKQERFCKYLRCRFCDGQNGIFNGNIWST